MLRELKNSLKRIIFILHKFLLRFGIYVAPSHYYSSHSNILDLEKNRPLWQRRSELVGIKIDIEEQKENLKKICLPFQDEYRGNENYEFAVKHKFGPGFGYLEAQALHGVIRYFKPQRIIEVGSGVSTYCMVEACKKNEVESQIKTNITCIEPFPSHELKKMSESETIKLLPNAVQSVPFEIFLELKDNDLLFIDSSHISKPGSDVNFLILDVLPRLQKGVIVHFHDIDFPYDYPRDTLKTFIHPNETSLLRAYLISNPKVEILFCMSLLHYDAKTVLGEIFPEYHSQEDQDGLMSDKYKPFTNIKEHFPSSIYLQIT